MEIDFRKTGYRFLEDDLIEFCFKPSLYDKIHDGEDIYVCGSFNGWLNSADSSWKLIKKVSKGEVLYTLLKNSSLVMIPGNTGYPEFRFFSISQVTSRILNEKKPDMNFTFYNNKIILKNKEESDEIKKLNKEYVLRKSLADFDVNCPACRAEISNVRLVPATKCLFRGYNPFKRSKNDYDTEDLRIQLVQKAYEIYGIKSDITLNGYEGANYLEGETLPDCIKEIEKADNRLCVNIDYNLVYFHSDAFDYASTLQKISKFIMTHPGPFYLHCRLGSDRTGVTSAVFAALCGASWNSIAEDYEKTSNMGICEYRNRKLLQYSIYKMIGKDPSSCKDLSEVMKKFFIEENILTSSEIEELIEKLNQPCEKKETDFFDFTGNHICSLRHSQKK